MGEYVIYCHLKFYQIPLYHSTNKKIDENSEKRSNHHFLCYSPNFFVAQTLVFPRNKFVKRDWWCVTSQICSIVLLIGWSKFPSWHDQSEALCRRGYSDLSSVWNFISDVISRANQQWRRKMSAVFSGYKFRFCSHFPPRILKSKI